MKSAFLIILSLALAEVAEAKPRHVAVFIALCDNKTQGIEPVGQKIGNGDNPDDNLYWGCTDGFGCLFRRSKQWKVITSESDVSPAVLRRVTLSHIAGDIEMTAYAYRGSEIKQCIKDFELAAAGKTYDLVAYIGHNGLMDFQLTPPEPTPANTTEVIVLCCLSEKYFSGRLTALGCRPVLMTRDLMYPGSFLLDAAISRWKTGGSVADVREAAAHAYANNQKISVRAARGVFSSLGNIQRAR